MTDLTPVTPGNAGKLALRERVYQFVNAVLLALLGVGVITGEELAVWTEFGLGAVTLVFAIAYATSNARIALYALTGPLAALLGFYGIAQQVDWAVVAAAVAQALGITVAAAKVVQLPKDASRAPLAA